MSSIVAPSTPDSPRVSVVMTVYRDFRFLDRAVDSILAQTYRGLELIVVDDGNQKDALFAALAARDPRIRIVSSPVNIGTAAGANLGIASARGYIIARLDADDVAEPGRIAAQVAALDADPDLGFVGGAVTLIDEADQVVGSQPMPETDLEIRWTILFHNPFYHSAVAFRRVHYDTAGGYRVEERVSQDHYLWFEMLPHCRASNLAEPQVLYRLNMSGLTVANSADNPRARTHAIREAEWKRLGLTFDLHDNDLAGRISGFLRGNTIAVPGRGEAYRKILDVLAVFLASRRPFARPEDREAADRLVRGLMNRMLAEPPAPAEMWSLRRRFLRLSPKAAVRLLLSRGGKGPEPVALAGVQAAPPPEPTPPAAAAAPTDHAPWYAGKTFSTDWTTRHLGVWETLLADRRDEPLDIVEIGSWEGRSAVFFMNYFPNARLTCIDTFEGSAEHHTKEKWSSQLSHIENRFDANLAAFADRIEKLKARSFEGLAGLVTAGRRFDVAFIDGSHHSADVMSDAVLSWPMVRPGGLVIFDDYDWNQEIDEVLKPKLGVDAFLATRPGEYRELHRGYQLIVQKLAG